MPLTPAPVFTRRDALACLGAVALASTGLPAWAAPDTRFEPQLTAQGTTLVLNGSGTRYRAGIFKVYYMALYTTRKVSTAQELLALPGPKRLQFVALRELPGTDLGRLFLQGMGDNSPKDKMTRHVASTTRLIEVFSGRSKLVAGDSFAMDFVPDKGTTFYIAGQPQGAPVGDDEFFSMVLRIWFGDKPADGQLRDALLGQN